MWKSWKFWLGLAVSLACLWLSLRAVRDWAAVGRALLTANLWLLIPGILLYLGGYYSRAERVAQILRPFKVIKASRVVAPLVIGFMFNNILPGRLGEFVFAYQLGKKEGISRTTSFAAVVISRILDGFVILCFFLFGLMAFLPLAGGREISPGSLHLAGLVFSRAEILGKIYLAGILGLLVFGAVFLGCFSLIVWKDLAVGLIHRVLGFFPDRISGPGKEALEKFIAGLLILSNAKALFSVFLFNFLPWSLEALTYLLTGWALGLDLNFRQVCLVMGMSNLAMILPSAPGGLGLFEFAGLMVLLLFGFASDLSVAFILLIHAIILLPINLWGFYHLGREGLSFKQALHEGRPHPGPR